jgi:hypothetical protein
MVSDRGAGEALTISVSLAFAPRSRGRDPAYHMNAARFPAVGFVNRALALVARPREADDQGWMRWPCL